MRDTLGAMRGMRAPLGKNCLSIRITNNQATVLLGSARAVSGVSSANPALNSASMHAKTTSQFSLGGTLLVQFSHQRALCGSQCSFGVIVHTHIQSIVGRTPAECANLL